MRVSHSQVSSAERGLQDPSGAFRKKAARALGLSVAQLWPRFFFLTDRAGTRFALPTADGRIMAFSTEGSAKACAGLGQGLCVRGPAPPGFFALAYGITESDVPDRLLIDPSPAEVVELCGLQNNDGAAPTKGNAVATSTKLASAARHGSG
jgi:hypothetical protein